MKNERWYEHIENDMMAIYDQPYPEISGSVSIVSKNDLEYYRRNFKLSKIWKATFNEQESNE